MQKKKELLKIILTKLVPYRNLSSWFLILLENDADWNLSDSLYPIICKEIKNIKDKEAIEKINVQLKKIKEAELDSEQFDEWFFDDLLQNV